MENLDKLRCQLLNAQQLCVECSPDDYTNGVYKVMAKKKPTYQDDLLDTAVASIVVDSEYQTAKNNNAIDNAVFESLLDMLDLYRSEKDYDWMSDYYIPEMNSIILAEMADCSNQYFQSRDFVECKLDLDMPGAMEKARAAKKLINNTLNDRKIFYYAKYMQLRTINAISTRGCYILAKWVRDEKPVKRTVMKRKRTGVDPNTQMPQFEHVAEEVDFNMVHKDHFDFDVIDPRNVFTDNKYCYSLQQKDWITVRYEGNYDNLKANEDALGYINLDRVKEAVKNLHETDTSRESYNRNTSKRLIENTPVKNFDVLDRYGKFWAIVTEQHGEDGYPTKADPGIGTDGQPLEKAELIETIITYALIGSHKIMIRFMPTPNIDSEGTPFKPLARGFCYVHPTKDEGMSDGRNMRELQIATNDTFNMNADRTKLATMPTFIVNKNSFDDFSQLYMEPEHPIQVENIETDIKELVIRDNIPGALNLLAMLKNEMQQVTARYPSTMGDPNAGKSGTTATAIMGSDQRSSSRANYKSLNFEYIFLQEFYWLILQMTARFAYPETAMKLMGNDAQYFAPHEDYTYTPVSSNIEQEYSKQRKVTLYDQMIGRLSGLAKGIPEVLPVIAHITGRQAELMGDEFQEIKPMIEKLMKAKWQEGQQGGGEGGPAPASNVSNAQPPMTQNQHGLPVQGMEAQAREVNMPPGGQLPQ
jgi:hypothetical protein